MKELFGDTEDKKIRERPLAIRLRPVKVDEFFGQEHIMGEGKLLRKLIEKDHIPSSIFYGPPGCGKTALAMLIAKLTRKHFCHLNAVTATVSDVRQVISLARHKHKEEGERTILFLDEISHFNKLQQDALMQDIEEGTVILIGATTHNPYFYINTPLLSRASVFQFKPLESKDVKKIVLNALNNRERGLGGYNAGINDDALLFLSQKSEGDIRRALNALEAAVATSEKDAAGKIIVDIEKVGECMGSGQVSYDRDEDEHYDTISAFIKSMRGSDADAALYWLAKMVAGGEDPRFIARRVLICASEDIGNADPQALVVANACFNAVALVGMPEAKIILAQAVIYLATAPKSNSSYNAIEKAISEVKREEAQKVPVHLKSSGYKGAENLGSGEGYLYPHDFPEHYVPQKYMPSEKIFYIPSDSGYEKRIKFFMNHLQRLKKDYEKRDQKRVHGQKKPDR